MNQNRSNTEYQIDVFKHYKPCIYDRIYILEKDRFKYSVKY